MQRLKVIWMVLLVLFALAQFLRPVKLNPAVNEAQTIQSLTQMTPRARAIVERACRDCHSNNTQWPWYSHVAPVSWYVIDHVNHGRSHLNFSDWADYDQTQARQMLDDICKEVSVRAMPLRSYLLMHSDARLSDADIKGLCDWTEAERQRLSSTHSSPVTPSVIR